MKSFLHLTVFLALAAAPALAETKAKAGPRHGRLLALEGTNAEFLIEKDRTVSIAFYDAAGKPQPAEAQVITVTAEAPAGKTKLELEKQGDLFISKAPLPAGDGYQIVVQAKPSADAKPKIFRIKLDLHECGECHLAEYACICNH